MGAFVIYKIERACKPGYVTEILRRRSFIYARCYHRAESRLCRSQQSTPRQWTSSP